MQVPISDDAAFASVCGGGSECSVAGVDACCGGLLPARKSGAQVRRMRDVAASMRRQVTSVREQIGAAGRIAGAVHARMIQGVTFR